MASLSLNLFKPINPSISPHLKTTHFVEIQHNKRNGTQQTVELFFQLHTNIPTCYYANAEWLRSRHATQLHNNMLICHYTCTKGLVLRQGTQLHTNNMATCRYANAKWLPSGYGIQLHNNMLTCHYFDTKWLSPRQGTQLHNNIMLTCHYSDTKWLGQGTELHNNGSQMGPEFYVELLQRCVDEQSYMLGKQIHGLIIKEGEIFARNEYIGTKLVIFYAKCDDLVSSNLLFRSLCVRNVFSWAAIIGLNSRLGFNEQALLGYCEMLENGIFPDNFVIPNALKACGAEQCLGFGRGIHGYVIKLGFDVCVFVGSSLIDMYGKCGVIEDAKNVFDGILEKNVVVWNSLIVCYVQNGMNDEAMRLFYDMRCEGVEPSRVSISSFLSASANLGGVDEGRQGHALAILYGLELGNILGSSVINFYSKIDWVKEAELVFTRMIEKDVVTWNLLISGYVQLGLAENALNLCRKMRLQGLRFDCVTMASFFSACADIGNSQLGKEGHSYCIRNNLDSDVVLSASMINMYSSKEIDYARRVFDSSLEKDLVMWNSILAAYAELGLSGEALELFYQMQLQGLQPNLISWNSIFLALLRNHLVDQAKSMFSQMQAYGIEPNVVTWTTLITGLVQNGLAFEAMLQFQNMLVSGIRPNSMTLTGLLSACIDMTSLLLGKSVHGYITRQWRQFPLEISTSLVDMYAKCGNIAQASNIFDMSLDKGLVLYNAMILGYGLHSQASQALALYMHMKEEGIEPNDLTFTSLLSACSHEGLLDKGLDIFADMVSVYNMTPRKEHYGCIVSLLCRSGDVDEAIMVIQNMSIEPDAKMLASLLSACREYNHVELGEYISTHLLELEPENTANYVALSNVSASGGKWVQASEWRKLMRLRDLDKNPGCSWVQIGTEFHVFVANDRSHSQKDEINLVLALLYEEMTPKI